MMNQDNIRIIVNESSMVEKKKNLITSDDVAIKSDDNVEITKDRRLTTAKLIGEQAYEFAVNEVATVEMSSRFFNKADEDEIPKLRCDEIVLGGFLGTGGFNDAYELQRLDLVMDYDISKDERKRRLELARSIDESETCQYAIKFMKEDVMLEPESCLDAAADILIETKFLASLRHPNIVRLHGLCSEGAKGFCQGKPMGYFLVIDRLVDTLDKRLLTWKELEQRKKEQLEEHCEDHLQCEELRRLLIALFLRRLQAAQGISSALAHLHDKDVIFRDLKPNNIGFDSTGVVKIFDFGLAKELNPKHHFSDGSYVMSGETGCLRYMAPEVHRRLPYGLSADVYSFGLILWQIISLERPYSNMTLDEHKDHVTNGDVRPELQPQWPSKLRNAMKWSWASDPFARPPIQDVHDCIESQVYKMHRQLEDPYESDMQGSRSSSGSIFSESEESKRSGTYSIKGGTRRRSQPNERTDVRKKSISTRRRSLASVVELKDIRKMRPSRSGEQTSENEKSARKSKERNKEQAAMMASCKRASIGTVGRHSRDRNGGSVGSSSKDQNFNILSTLKTGFFSKEDSVDNR
eukprot:CAMPEP_0195298712 /NCGR_PEP_ID=MMETSP0707-20130614/24065_1 /TAXON_ID=33640 /ORGANISM="Asterionellopsis glacialis, Strain CCMP134" /LENGTH=577 /DNA_ID=CAMNT_0040360915 /DNA_START=162 /DNA_END=1895 /DNA_ORIENTATION=+